MKITRRIFILTFCALPFTGLIKRKKLYGKENVGFAVLNNRKILNGSI